MSNYAENVALLQDKVANHAFIRNVSKHRLPDGTLDVEGNLKLWNDGIFNAASGVLSWCEISAMVFFKKRFSRCSLSACALRTAANALTE